MAIGVTGLTVHTQGGGGTWTDYGTGGGSVSTTATFLSGTTARGRKFTAARGFGFEVNASGTDLSNSIILVRVLVNGGLDNALSAGGIMIRLEDTSANISDWYVAGSDTYNGGWVELVIDTANAESANSGTAASLSAIQYVGIFLDPTASSGGDPNVYVDEILSMPNTGLTLTGNTTQLFDELGAWDDTSLYGIITRKSGVVFSKCPLILSPDASDHASVDEILVLEEPVYHDATNVDSALTLQGLSSADADTITLTRLIAICEDNGDIGGTNADKELDFASAGDIVADTCTFRGFNGTTMALGGTGNNYDDCTFQGCSQITDTGAVVRDGFVRDTAAAATESSLLWTTSSDWDGTTFIMGASNSHAIEIETNITDAWNGFTFIGYGSTGGGTSVGDEVFNSNNPTGSTTINATNITGTISFYQRGAGSNPTINNNVSVTFDGMKDNTEVRIYATSGGAELDGIENATAGSPDDRSFVASVAGATSVTYTLFSVLYEPITVENFTWPATAQTINVQQRFDRNNNNPA
jgi:hypothetical protein